MSNFDDMINEFNIKEDLILQDFDILYKNIDNVEEIINNTSNILDQIETDFLNETQLEIKDIPYLSVAIALHSVRWFFQSKVLFDFAKVEKVQRHDSKFDGKLEKKKAKEKIDDEKIKDEKTKKSRYPSSKEILLNNVPYDAMEGTEHVVIPGVTEKGKNIYSKNHHSATLGHDPLLGYVFGTMNILTRTITFKTPDFLSNPVKMYPNTNRQYVIQHNIGILKLLNDVKNTIFEDNMRLKAALIKQSLHIQSDKYCKQGLPIPLISPKIAQYLLENDWNSYELERLIKYIGNNSKTVGIQTFLSLFINYIVEFIYMSRHCTNNGISDIDKIKCKKIVTYANIIANSSNIIFSIVNKKPYYLDFGGFLVTIQRIYTDRKLIDAILQEFIDSNFSELIKESQMEYNTIGLDNNFENKDIFLDYDKLKAMTFPSSISISFIPFIPVSKKKISRNARMDAGYDYKLLFNKLKEILDREKTKLQVESEVKTQVINELKDKYYDVLKDISGIDELDELINALQNTNDLEKNIIMSIDNFKKENI